MSKIICHMDVDAFYCQVEHKRLGIARDVPLAVQQWHSLIAVNYAARAFGVKRHETVVEALKKCPHLCLVHVATFLLTDCANPVASYLPSNQVSKESHKVCLDSYRAASCQVFGIIRDLAKAEKVKIVFEKASIDEAFIDCTNLQYPKEESIMQCIIGSQKGNDELCSRIKQVACFASAIRAKIANDLGITCSIGIAQSKMLAKLCSSMHKPNMQSLLLEENVLAFLQGIPLAKVRNFGGKLGEQISSFVPKANPTLQDFWHLSVNDLAQLIEEHDVKIGAVALYDKLRGIDNETVSDKGAAKLLLSAKAIRKAVATVNELFPVIRIVASELFNRVEKNYELTSTLPATLTIGYKRVSSASALKSISLACNQADFVFMENFFKSVVAKVRSEAEKIFPCFYFSLAATRFGAKENSISCYLAKPIAESVPQISSLKVDQHPFHTRCPKCHKSILNDKENVQEHEDYHFALEFI